MPITCRKAEILRLQAEIAKAQVPDKVLDAPVRYDDVFSSALAHIERSKRTPQLWANNDHGRIQVEVPATLEEIMAYKSVRGYHEESPEESEEEAGSEEDNGSDMATYSRMQHKSSLFNNRDSSSSIKAPALKRFERTSAGRYDAAVNGSKEDRMGCGASPEVANTDSQSYDHWDAAAARHERYLSALFECKSSPDITSAANSVSWEPWAALESSRADCALSQLRQMELVGTEDERLFVPEDRISAALASRCPLRSSATSMTATYRHSGSASSTSNPHRSSWHTSPASASFRSRISCPGLPVSCGDANPSSSKAGTHSPCTMRPTTRSTSGSTASRRTSLAGGPVSPDCCSLSGATPAAAAAAAVAHGPNTIVPPGLRAVALRQMLMREAPQAVSGEHLKHSSTMSGSLAADVSGGNSSSTSSTSTGTGSGFAAGSSERRNRFPFLGSLTTGMGMHVPGSTLNGLPHQVTAFRRSTSGRPLVSSVTAGNEALDPFRPHLKTHTRLIIGK